jgi:hypothetical protein
MMIEVELPRSLVERIERAATAAGSDVPTLVRQAVETAFASGTAEVASPSSGERWLEEFRAFVASQPRYEHFVDDSRESIYGDER